MSCSYKDLRNLETTVYTADTGRCCKRDDCDVVIQIFDSSVNFCCRRKHHCDSVTFDTDEEQAEEE